MQLSIIVLWLVFLYSNAIHYFASKEILLVFPKHIVLLGFLLFVWGILSKEIKVSKINSGFIYTNIAGVLITLVFYLLLYISGRYIDTAALNDELGITLFYAVCFISLICLSRSQVFPFAKMLLLWLLIVALVLNLIDFTTGNPDIFSSIVGRASGLYVNPNIAGLVLAISYVLVHKDILKSFRLILFVLFVLAMLSTASRAGLLYLALIVFYLLVSGYFFIWTKKAFFINAVIMLSVLIFWASIQQGTNQIMAEISDVSRVFETRFSNFVQIMQGDESSLDREEDTRFTLLIGHARLYLENPVLGNGLGFSRSQVLTGFKDASHNVYLHLLNEYGIIGLLFYLYFIYKSLGGEVLKPHNTNFEPHLLLLIVFLGGFFSHNLNRFYSVAILLAYAGAKYRVFAESKVNKRRRVRAG